MLAINGWFTRDAPNALLSVSSFHPSTNSASAMTMARTTGMDAH
jgi:hypothetical protein